MSFIAILLVLGASGLVAQIVLLRELLVVFSGNELSLGLILGNWLALEAAGSFLAGRIRPERELRAKLFILLQAAFAATLPVALFAIRGLRGLAGIPAGEGFGIWTMFWASGLVLSGAGLLHGALFALSPGLRKNQDAAGWAYGWEAVGTLAGGVVLTFLLIPYFHSFDIVLGTAVLDVLFCLLIRSWYLKSGPAAAATAWLGAGVLAGGLMFSGSGERLQRLSLLGQWPGQRVVSYRNSVYGNVAVLESGGQYVFMSNGSPALVAPVPDVESVEDLAHIPLLAHPSPRRVLVLGGGAGGLLRELLKQPVLAADYAELDPLLLEAVARFSNPLTGAELADPRVRVRFSDGRRFLKHSQDRYDVILLGGARPSTLEANRLFTKEFLAAARAHLAPGGILAFSLPGSTVFLEKNLARLNACMLATVGAVFREVRIVPGDRNLFLASDSALRLDPAVLGQRLRARGIKTGFLTAEHVAFRLEPQWLDALGYALAPVRAQAGMNRDFQPRAVIHDLANWSAMLSPRIGRGLSWAASWTLSGAMGLIALSALLYWVWHRCVRRLTAAPLAIAATGFGGMVYSMCLTFAFQAVYGYVYQWIGVLVSVFMAGAAGASLFLAKPAGSARRLFLMSEAALVLFSLLLAAGWQGLGSMKAPESLLLAGFVALCLASGALTGAQFPLACRLQAPGAVGRLYACDLAGGWVGGILGGVVLLPVLGLRDACLIVAALKLASLGLSFAAMPSGPRGTA
ncbi:MAG: fused MFS/spermidine synthase [Elusimicrobiota bacterium]|jgi:spermidine synthase